MPGPSPGRDVLSSRSAGQAHHEIVRAFTPDHGSNERKFVGHLCDARKFFADLDAGYVCFDGTEFTSVFARSVHFQVPHILVRGAAREHDHDDRFVVDTAG